MRSKLNTTLWLVHYIEDWTNTFLNELLYKYAITFEFFDNGTILIPL